MKIAAVETHVDHRRQGLAAAVVHAAGRHAIDQLRVVRLVIAADHDGNAIGIYRRLGVTDTERHNQLERRPNDWQDEG
jgi:ribosomal protein S18 acetylase RimI-like enzyme